MFNTSFLHTDRTIDMFLKVVELAEQITLQDKK